MYGKLCRTRMLYRECCTGNVAPECCTVVLYRVGGRRCTCVPACNGKVQLRGRDHRHFVQCVPLIIVAGNFVVSVATCRVNGHHGHVQELTLCNYRFTDSPIHIIIPSRTIFRIIVRLTRCYKAFLTELVSTLRTCLRHRHSCR